MIEKGLFSREDTVLFRHTGGGPALFSYGAALLH
jgi:1-aminocyclopropane-1-carboxylate deaminase/D-cysteine desulfhydrase-like pyridoxal-dependent ACC family enzyme